jgi:hypothetical protein
VTATLDHVFICSSAGAPEADALSALGLTEGSPNVHHGQGTACRRFFFDNAYLELLWVCDAVEAQGDAVRRAQLWERWTNRGDTACPFGIVLRPAADAAHPEPPFAAWAYRPSYLPPPFAIDVARDTALDEPAFFHLGFLRQHSRAGHEPRGHALPLSDVTGVQVWSRATARSSASRAVEAAGLVTFHTADNYLLELTFDRAIRGASADLRPDLPLVIRW